MLEKVYITLAKVLIALIIPLAVFFATPPARAERPILNPEIGNYPDGSTSSSSEKEKRKNFEVIVEGQRASPAWSQGHHFANASFWRLDPGNREVLLWYNATHRDPEGWENQELELELEEGITSFLQLDVLVSAARERGRGSWREKGMGLEARIAPQKNYGAWPLNPVLYLEYTMLKDAPSRMETTLLLGGKILEGWYGVMNGFMELEPGEGELPEYGFSAATSLEVKSLPGLSGGVESRLEFEEEIELQNGGEEREHEGELMLGPSLSYSVPRTDLRFTACVLFSAWGESFSIEPVLVGSYDF